MEFEDQRRRLSISSTWIFVALIDIRSYYHMIIAKSFSKSIKTNESLIKVQFPINNWTIDWKQDRSSSEKYQSMQWNPSLPVSNCFPWFRRERHYNVMNPGRLHHNWNNISNLIFLITLFEYLSINTADRMWELHQLASLGSPLDIRGAFLSTYQSVRFSEALKSFFFLSPLVSRKNISSRGLSPCSYSNVFRWTHSSRGWVVWVMRQ